MNLTPFEVLLGACVVAAVLLFLMEKHKRDELDKRSLAWERDRPYAGQSVILPYPCSGLAQLRKGRDGVSWVRINLNEGSAGIYPGELAWVQKELGIEDWKFSHECPSHWEAKCTVLWYRVKSFTPSPTPPPSEPHA